MHGIRLSTSIKTRLYLRPRRSINISSEFCSTTGPALLLVIGFGLGRGCSATCLLLANGSAGATTFDFPPALGLGLGRGLSVCTGIAFDIGAGAAGTLFLFGRPVFFLDGAGSRTVWL